MLSTLTNIEISVVYTVLIVSIIIMAVTSFKLWKKVSKHEEEVLELEKKKKEKVDYFNDSLRVISLAVLQGQCEISEGCIRIRMLLDRHPEIDHKNIDFNSFFEMYEKIKDFKTHANRKELSVKERFLEDSARFRVEDEYKDEIKKGCDKLLIYLKENYSI